LQGFANGEFLKVHIWPGVWAIIASNAAPDNEYCFWELLFTRHSGVGGDVPRLVEG
jgi:hypothetical protein